MAKIKFTKVFTIVFYILIFFLLLKNSLNYLDPDLGWHLKAGEEVAISKNVNSINHYNYVFESGDTWVNHEWLSDFILFSVYDNYPYLFLNIIFALIIILVLVLAKNFIINNFTKDKHSVYIVLLLSLFGVIASKPHLGIRIQEVSLLFLFIEITILHLFEKRSVENKKNNWTILFCLIPLLFLWANMHAGFLLGIFVLFFYCGLKIFEKIIYNFRNQTPLIEKFSKFFTFNTILENKDVKIFFVFTILASLSTALTPYGLNLFEFLSSYQNTAYLKIISEWLPQYYYPFSYWQIIYIGVTMAFLIYSFFIEKNKKDINNLWNFFIILLFVVLSIKSKRHFPLLFIVSLPFLSTVLYNEISPILKNISIRKTKIDNFIKVYLFLLFACAISSIILSTKKIEDPFTYFCDRYPCQALEFLQKDKNLENARIFNEYSWGGYLIHQWPEKKLFIDGRLPQKKIKDHSYVEEYKLFFSEEKTISELINEYQIELFLIGNQEKKIKINWIDKNIFGIKEEKVKDDKNNLINFLEKNDQFEKIYEDKVGLIYHKL